MQRIAILTVAILVAVVAVVAFAPDAKAHGGQFRGPGDGVPPGLREPSDPTPPPPPPPSGPPTTPSPVTPTPSTPPPTAPSTPSAPPPVTSTPDLGGTKPKTTAGPSFEDWTFWYHNNKAEIENLKAALYRLRGSENPLFVSGDENESNVTAATRLTQKKVQQIVIPALLWAMETKNSGHQDTESAAYIALAKIARDPVHIETIMKGLDRSLKHDLIVQESAALGLGLLRRADPSDQFTARELDKVREFLFGVFENDKYQARTRGFAAIAIGLLGDQPTGSALRSEDTTASTDGSNDAARATTGRLFELLKADYSNQDLYVGLLMAIGMQPHTSVTLEEREVLADAALKGRLYRSNVNDLIRSYAAHSLGKIGTRADIRTLENVLTARRGMSKNVQRSAAVGLGLLGRLVAGEARVDVAKVLLKSYDKLKDNSTKNFALMSLAYLLIDDIKSSSTDVLGNTQADELLLQTAEKGSYMHKPFGALALGLVLRDINDELEIDKYQEFKDSALGILREGVVSKKMDKKGRGAFCTALGIAQDADSSETLRAMVADTKGDKQLRGYAALGLGLIGNPTSEVMKTIADSMRERSSEELRRQTAVALGLLGNHKIQGTGKTAIELLVDELKQAKSQNHKGQVVLALASIGDHRAVDPLVGILQNKGEQDLTRALACAGLGLIGDLELIPSMARGSQDVNYRASTDLVNEFLSIL